jgi:hypothetical protein
MLIADSPAKSKPWPKSRLPRSGLVQHGLWKVGLGSARHPGRIARGVFVGGSLTPADRNSLARLAPVPQAPKPRLRHRGRPRSRPAS